jgi:LssY C-terminus
VVDGLELWLGAGTHDTGAVFNARSFKFTHKIDQNLDEERDKIATDLRFAGCTDAEMRVDRPAAASNGSERSSVSDGAATVLSLTDCQLRDTATEAIPKPGTQASRLARRMILEARNHLFRENPYYWTFQLVKRVLHHSDQQGDENALVQ